VEIPIIGRSGFQNSSEMILAIIMGAFFFSILTPFLPFAHRAKHQDKLAILTFIWFIVILVIATQTFPYTVEQPKRVIVSEKFNPNSDGVNCTMTIESDDPYPVTEVLNNFNSSKLFGLKCDKYTCTYNVPSPNWLGEPQVNSKYTNYDANSNISIVVLEVSHPGTVYSIMQLMTRSPLIAWSITGEELPTPSVGAYPYTYVYTLQYVSNSVTKWRFWIELSGNKDFEVCAIAQFMGVNQILSPDLVFLRSQLPPWAVLAANTHVLQYSIVWVVNIV